MKKFILFIALIILLTSCGSSSKDSYAPSNENYSSYGKGGGGAKSMPAPMGKAEGVIGGVASEGGPAAMPAPNEESTSFSTAQASTNQVIERKIIRNAELDLELEKPAEAYIQISAIANTQGGFIVTSESQQIGENGQRMTVIIRVPAAKFDDTLKQIRALAGRLLREKASGQDVTEEFVDLTARLKAKHALEDQFLEILKKATKVSDMLEVQNNLNNVRTEIERIEGRMRFLENQASLSTITITLQTPQPLVSGTSRGFMYKLKDAVSDAIEIAQDVFLGLIRFVGLLVPLFIFIVLPLYFVFKLVRRSWYRRNTTVQNQSNPINVDKN
ncbi:MAG: DUF4349 domain-containing protein [Blastocatellia bacterium]|nr:DUF4349 domain-containing protein [Blastocatellia bacterium]MBL8197193.1 DUF4349 domain-containing protein [Blastocatellia bacterium]